MPDNDLRTVEELEKLIADLKEENRIYSGVINLTDPDYYDALIANNEERIAVLETQLEQLKKTEKSDDLEEKEAETEKVRSDLLELKDKLYNYRMGVYTLAERDYDPVVEEKMISDIEGYVRTYKGILTPEELKNIDAEYNVDRRLKSELGEDLAEFAKNYLVWYTRMMNDLHSADYGTPEYDKARTRFDKFFEAAKKLDGKHDISVSFDEDTQVFSMDFDGKLPTIHTQVVNNGTLDKMKKDTKKDGLENDADKYEADYRKMVDDEISKLSRHFKGEDKLSEEELLDVFNQHPEIEDYHELSVIEAENIELLMRGERFGKLTGALNNDLAFIIDLYLEILSIKEELSKLEPGTAEFEELFLELNKDIKQIKGFSDDEIKVEYDEENYLLKVTIKDGKIEDLEVPENFIETQVVSDKTLEELRKASKKPDSLTKDEKRLKDALIQPSIKYMMWYEKVLIRMEQYDEETKQRELDKVRKVINDKKFDGIPEERKKEIFKQVMKEREEHLINKYGQDLFDLLSEFAVYFKVRLAKSKAATYGTPEFDQALKDVQELIEKARKVKDVTVTYNEDNQNLSIVFPQGIDPIFVTVVSKEALEAMRKDRSVKPNADIEEQFRADFKAEYERYISFVTSVLENHNYDEEEMDRQYDLIESFRDSYSGLSDDRKKEIEDELHQEYEQKLKEKYGEEIYKLLSIVLYELSDVIEDLKEAKYGTPEFDRAKADFDKLLEEVKNTPGVTVKFNEDNQNLSIVFANPEIEPIYTTVVSKETLEEMHKPKSDGKGDPKPEPGKDDSGKKPEKPNKDMQAEIDEYIARIAEINNMVDEIGRLNTIQDVSNDPLSIPYMDSVIENEKIVREYESLINKEMLQLSKFRMDFTKKYGKYIYSYPEVKETTIKEVTYKDSLEEFTEKANAIVIKAEYERTRDNIDEAEIAKLNEFIDAQNAMVSRRLVHRVASDSSYDSKQFLDKRRKDKQAQRKEILQQEKGPEFIENYTIKGTTLNFNPAVKDKIDTSKAVVIAATDQINVELYKSRIVIKMTKQVKDKLAKLKTAIKLTNKNGDDQIIDVKRNKTIEFGAKGDDLTGLGLEVVSQDPNLSDEAMYSMDLEELKSRSK